MIKAARLPRVSFPPPLIAPGGFAEAIAEAYEGNTARLCDYLHSDKRLGPIQRNLLADLIYRGLHRGKGKGRPRGSSSRMLHGSRPFLNQYMRRRIIAAIRHAAKKYREQHALKRIPNWLYAELIAQADDLYRTDYHNRYYDINFNDIRRALSKKA
jgi:hypothetical protein